MSFVADSFEEVFEFGATVLSVEIQIDTSDKLGNVTAVVAVDDDGDLITLELDYSEAEKLHALAAKMMTAMKEAGP